MLQINFRLIYKHSRKQNKVIDFRILIVKAVYLVKSHIKIQINKCY
ncbi:unnamed protein product [Paramecium sonneborni]|uniref:Uncharacterized protein n=1 Tax=Paramecium sonneborni TaxID=65129 RepID=A0A8S1QH46_9CILI|nr:unnamed protein product [Paramecium sonneborni]